MRNFIRGLVLILVLSGLVLGGYQLFLFLKNRQNSSPPANEQPVQRCNFRTETCEPITANAETGVLKVTTTVDGQVGKGIEIDLFSRPQPEEAVNFDAYVKISNRDGIALFEAVPAGTYYIFFNNTGFPKEFGEPEGLGPVGQKVVVVKGQTKEANLDLSRSQ
ncbi:MAG TPA: hypothetical protein VI794_01965 [Patescibacteria group bacterium]|nr:hypothetical protein [Patescibacteria group bacterium]